MVNGWISVVERSGAGEMTDSVVSMLLVYPSSFEWVDDVANRWTMDQPGSDDERHEGVAVGWSRFKGDGGVCRNNL